MTTIKIGLKGSSTSGNFGHAGRPGKLGGSVGKGASGAPMLEVTNRRKVDSGINNADVVTLTDGSVWLEKDNSIGAATMSVGGSDLPTYDQAAAEVLAYQLSKELGAIVPETYIVKDQITRQRFVEGNTALDALDRVDQEDVLSTREGAGMVAMDFVTGNIDRRSCNWMVDAHYKPIAIDNGLAQPSVIGMGALVDTLSQCYTYNVWMNKPLPADLLAGLRRVADNTSLPSGYRARAKYAAEHGVLPGKFTYSDEEYGI